MWWRSRRNGRRGKEEGRKREGGWEGGSSSSSVLGEAVTRSPTLTMYLSITLQFGFFRDHDGLWVTVTQHQHNNNNV